jgi:stage III sporulation protein SpoIIIAA
LQKVITDDLGALIDILPPRIRESLLKEPDVSQLLELVFDLGRLPEARFPDREVLLNHDEITREDLGYLTTRISAFSGDNRAGIERTLHRISALRNRQGDVVGMTLRVGRAVSGVIQIIQDMVASGKNILMVGRPGIGKTTMLRECARVLADDYKKRVIIVDTSNEIAGDGDIPHPAIGHARRMQVATPPQQHAVMIEAVENHMPEVIVIDEIGTEPETQAARTIAERGVQLIGTAHGNTLDNLVMNPTLANLIGGIQSVTLGDEEARRRRTQKSILERTSQPTFDVVVEILDRDQVSIHSDTANAVDALLRGQPLPTEVRRLDEQGEVINEKREPAATGRTAPPVKKFGSSKKTLIYLYGVNHGRLENTALERGITLDFTDSMAKASIFVTSKSYYRKRSNQIRDAENNRIPVYVLRGNTPAQMAQFLDFIFPDSGPVNHDSVPAALDEAREAVTLINGGEAAVDLSPQSAYIRRLQHLVAEKNDLGSRSTGKDPNRRVQIYR